MLILEEIRLQNQHRETIASIVRAATDWAANKLVELSGSPVARTGQVRACELVLQWAAGKPGHFVSIPTYAQGMKLGAAMDAVIAATLTGHCSVETAHELMDLLKKRAMMALPGDM